jgi:hypothetical protein
MGRVRNIAVLSMGDRMRFYPKYTTATLREVGLVYRGIGRSTTPADPGAAA